MGTLFKINGEWSYIPLYWEWLEDDLYKTLKTKIASKIKTILKMKTVLRTKTCLEDEDNLEDEDCLEYEDCRCKALKMKIALKTKTILKMEFVHARMCIGIFAMEQLSMQQSKDVLWHLCNGCALATCYDTF